MRSPYGAALVSRYSDTQSERSSALPVLGEKISFYDIKSKQITYKTLICWITGMKGRQTTMQLVAGVSGVNSLLCQLRQV